MQDAIALHILRYVVYAVSALDLPVILHKEASHLWLGALQVLAQVREPYCVHG